jgi:hypothetical protein
VELGIGGRQAGDRDFLAPASSSGVLALAVAQVWSSKDPT